MIKHFFLYYILLSKSFFKKPVFLILLLSIPLLTFGLKLVSQQDSGVLKIVLCAEDNDDTLVEDLIQTLTEEKSVLQFVILEDTDEAEDTVRKNIADAAWIFTKNFKEKLDFFSKYGYSDDSPVLVIEREDTIPLQLAKIKLFGIIYPHIAYSSYLNFAREKLLPEEELSEETLRQAYEISSVEGNFFNLTYLDYEENSENQNYVTAPLRGLLSLMILLCGLASVMFFFRDEETGMFERTPQRIVQRQLYVYEFAAIVPAASVSLAALFITKNTEKIWWECLIMIVFLLDCSVFCTLTKRIIRSPKVLGACLPFFLLGMLVLCPIFFSYHGLWMIQILLPPYYYLNAVHSINYLWRMIFHTVITGIILFFSSPFILRYLRPHT